LTRSKDVTAVIDYGVGNRGSIRNMVKAAGGAVTLADDPAAILAARRLILPGVGAFDACMAAFRAKGLDMAVQEAVFQRGVPLLGLCVGMQMLFDGSEEGNLPGLGWIPGRVRHLSGIVAPGTKIPHMGWTPVSLRADEPLAAGLVKDNRFYFVHSYYCDCAKPELINAAASYGGARFCVGVRSGTVAGFQFHPERSHRFGLGLIKNFLQQSCD
jgi:glutamine amidotransferase